LILLYSQVGELSEEQLDFLVDNLEEEWPEDRDYYINREMLELLKQRGADSALLHMLSQALGNRDEVDILWVDTDELEEMEEDEDSGGF
jgi:processive 1,2-diacylglycerol beta-glucosyltransferase